ncbi:MAG: CPBP family intramembrane glutamic endopeptidase [Balneolaceae bacterium]
MAEQFSSSSDYIQSWADRNGFAHWAVALIWLVVAFVLFQVVAGFVFVGLLLASGGISSAADVADIMMDRLDLMFIGNSSGQILFLGLATFLIVKLNVAGESRQNFLRFRWKEDTALFTGLSALLVVVVQPIILYLGHLNSLLPIPETFSDLQASQYEMFEQFLKQDGVMWFGLLHIALVPAFCEEILFRGYILRAFEKSWGIITAIVISGIVFGLFHIQLTNLLPLATLGMFFAGFTWLSASLWPAIAAHFINNGSAVVLATFYPDLAFADMTPETLPPLWMLIVSIVLTGFISYTMIKQSKFVNQTL